MFVNGFCKGSAIISFLIENSGPSLQLALLMDSKLLLSLVLLRALRRFVFNAVFL